jgi:hypothetical protein
MEKNESNLTNDLSKILSKKNFIGFWEAFDYLKLVNYDEKEALIISLNLFDGDVWGEVIGLNKSPDKSFYTDNQRPYEPDIDTEGLNGLEVEIFITTDKNKTPYSAIYKAYLKTRKYEVIPELEKNLKMLKIRLTTQVAIELFNDKYHAIRND